ncbi:hypothetical protein JHK87_001500 [Glycine soja]|nr:hypothetical protein JHK87_001500 [Glycine soja]
MNYPNIMHDGLEEMAPPNHEVSLVMENSGGGNNMKGLSKEMRHERTALTLGALLNATCGNATELIIAIFALSHNKISLVKYSLLGSIISNLLLVLRTSLFIGGLANLRQEQKYDRRQANMNLLMLFVALLCHLLPLLLHYVGASASDTADSSLQLSRAASIVMVIAYCAYLVFQLWTHRELFEA